MVGIMVMNHDDFHYFFGFDWAQPRAIIPWKGDPALISFASEDLITLPSTKLWPTESSIFSAESNIVSQPGNVKSQPV